MTALYFLFTPFPFLFSPSSVSHNKQKDVHFFIGSMLMDQGKISEAHEHFQKYAPIHVPFELAYAFLRITKKDLTNPLANLYIGNVYLSAKAATEERTVKNTYYVRCLSRHKLMRVYGSHFTTTHHSLGARLFPGYSQSRRYKCVCIKRAGHMLPETRKVA